MSRCLFYVIQMTETGFFSRTLFSVFPRCPFFLNSLRFRRASYALLCQPHDVVHDWSDYPLYYDPLYFPQYHSLLFQTENSVYHWLLIGLLQHFVHCPLSSFPKEINNSIKKIVFHAPNFHVQLLGVEIKISKIDVGRRLQHQKERELSMKEAADMLTCEIYLLSYQISFSKTGVGDRRLRAATI
jgi:hypothetical protein